MRRAVMAGKIAVAGCAALLVPLLMQSAARADETVPATPIVAPDRTGPIDFAADVLPMLRKNCVACHHGADAEAGVELDSAEAIRRGADDKPLVVPGKGNESLLLRVAARQRKPVMPPPDNKVGAAALTGEQLGLLRLWIDHGAKGETAPAIATVPRRPLPASLRPMLAMAISPDDEILACSRGQRLHVYDLRGPRLAAELADPQLPVSDGHGIADVDLIRSLAFDKSGTILASGGYRTVRLWQRPRATLVSKSEDAGKVVRSIALSPDGKYLAIGCEAGPIELRPLDDQGKSLVLTGHSGAVTAVVFTSAGFLSASVDKSVRRWNLADGSAAGKWLRPSEVRALAVIGNGEQVAAGEVDASIRIWPVAAFADAAAQEMLPAPQQELKGHSQAVTCLAAVPALKDRLVSGSEDGRVRLWDTANGMPVRDMGQETPVAGLALRGDGRRVVSIGPKSARLWNPEDGALVAEIMGDYRPVRDVARADGALYYARACVEYRKQDFREAEEALKRETAVVEGALKAKEMVEKTVAEKAEAAAKVVAARTAAEQKATELAAALKTTTDAVAAAKTAAEQAETAVKQKMAALDQAKAAADKDKENKDLAAAVTKSEQELADARTAKQNADAALAKANEARTAAEKASQQAMRAVDQSRDQARGPERELADAKNALVGAMNFIPTATAVLERAKATLPASQQAVAAAEALAAQRDMQKQALAAALPATQRGFRAAAFSADGRLLALGCDDNDVMLFDGDRGSPVETLETEPSPVTALAFGPDGQLFAAAGARLSIWQTPLDWKLIRTIGSDRSRELLVDRVLALDFSPDGKFLATAGGVAAGAGELKLWNVADGALVREFTPCHNDTIYSVRVSPDGALLATASADRLVKVFRVADGQLMQTLAGHGLHVLGVAWSKDGRTLASCGSDQSVKLWNRETGTATRTLRGDTYRVGEYRRAVTSLAFVGDTEFIVASGGDRTVRLHRAGGLQDVRCYLGGGSYFYAAVATSDGKWVIAGGHDGLLHFWNGENAYRQFAFEPDRPNEMVKAN